MSTNFHNPGGLLRRLIGSQQWLCRRFDQFLPVDMQVDGHADFQARSVYPHVRKGMRIYDVGGGKSPFFTPRERLALSLYVCGLDIDRAELETAPAGSYDELICTDIADFKGHGDADLVICQAVLEHVPDTARAIAAIASMLKPDGKALIFVPCRNALFARLNRLLPEGLKRKLLFGLFPGTRSTQGFPSYYDRCTPAELVGMSSGHGLRCRQLCCYYMSAYFSFFFPLYVLWRFWGLLARAGRGNQMCETFSLVLQKT